MGSQRDERGRPSRDGKNRPLRLGWVAVVVAVISLGAMVGGFLSTPPGAAAHITPRTAPPPSAVTDPTVTFDYYVGNAGQVYSGSGSYDWCYQTWYASSTWDLQSGADYGTVTLTWSGPDFILCPPEIFLGGGFSGYTSPASCINVDGSQTHFKPSMSKSWGPCTDTNVEAYWSVSWTYWVGFGARNSTT
jgi:hypothetical protein